jgi:hypothetical protein
MRTIKTPQTRCRAAVARCDITPSAGIYHRMWGAATHDRATGVHKPLLATLLWLEPVSGDRSQAVIILALDHCILDQADVGLIQNAVAAAAGVQPRQVLVTLSHTHAAGLMSRSRSALPGGELIGPYLDELAHKAAKLAADAADELKPATILYGTGRSTLAANRDYFDEERGIFVCGYNPAGPADDTVLVALVLDEGEHLLGTLVNYACHPTTLAWQNTLISPDYVGALREIVERDLPAPCLFLQGASGDLGPRVGFVGDAATADRNGAQLGYAALAALRATSSPGVEFTYAGPVVSGATIGTWKYRSEGQAALRRHAAWHIDEWAVPLTYRPDLPSLEQAQAAIVHWQQQENQARAAGDEKSVRDCHAQVERATRQAWRLRVLPKDNFPLRVILAGLGDALWLFVPGEHYQILQTSLRQRFPQQPIIIATLTGGWQPGYIPPAETYGRGIYQEQIAVVAAGSAEQLLDDVGRHMENLLTVGHSA